MPPPPASQIVLQKPIGAAYHFILGLIGEDMTVTRLLAAGLIVWLALLFALLVADRHTPVVSRLECSSEMTFLRIAISLYFIVGA